MSGRRRQAEPIACVYAIQHQYGRCYIGVTQDLRTRWQNHLSRLRHGKHFVSDLQADWDRDGPDAFDLLVLDLEATIEAERYWLEMTPVLLRYNPYPYNPLRGA